MKTFVRYLGDSKIHKAYPQIVLFFSWLKNNATTCQIRIQDYFSGQLVFILFKAPNGVNFILINVVSRPEIVLLDKVKFIFDPI